MNASWWRDSKVQASDLEIPLGRWPTHLELDGLTYEMATHVIEEHSGMILGVIYYRKDRTDTVTVLAA